ncbi:MAG: hypothetical protein AAF245_09650, partial [Pseudomonadota bacterium]
MRLGLVLAALVGLGVAPGHAVRAEGCPAPAELGQVVLPPAPCYDFEVSYQRPTRQYPHAVLGDDEEFKSILVKKDRFSIFINLPVDRVFEDLAPRVANVDGDPEPELIVIESFDNAGASLAIYDVTFSALGRPSQRRL